MSDPASRHPWDPRSALAPAERDGEFLHLMNTWKREVPLEASELYRRCRDQDYTLPGYSFYRWTPTVLMVSMATAVPAVTMNILSQADRPYGPLMVALYTLGAAFAGGLGGAFIGNKLSRQLGPVDLPAMLSHVKTARLTPDLLSLIEQMHQDGGELLAQLEEPDNHRLRETLNRLALCRWDLLSEMGHADSTLPNQIIEAYDKAAVPLMRSALSLNIVATGRSENRDEAVDELATRADALIGATSQHLDTQADRRDDVSLQAAIELVEINEVVIDAIRDTAGEHYAEGMSELEALIESDRELES